MTSNAGNGYANAALLDIATKKITWLTNDKWRGGFRQVLARRQAPYLDRKFDGNQEIDLYYAATRRALPCRGQRD